MIRQLPVRRDACTIGKLGTLDVGNYWKGLLLYAFIPAKFRCHRLHLLKQWPVQLQPVRAVVG